MFQRDEEDKQTRLLVIQCDSGHLNGDLIACARYRVYDERVNALNTNKIQNRDSVTHVLFIVNLPRQISSSSFVGFQGNPWISSHIDDLRQTSSDSIEPLQAIKTSISEVFIGEYIHDLAPLFGTILEQTPRQMSQSSNEKSLLEEGTTQQIPVCNASRDVEDEGIDNESGVHQIIPELVAMHSAHEEADVKDDVEGYQPKLQAESSSLGSSPIKQLPEFPRKSSEPTVVGPHRQTIFQKQGSDDGSLTGLAVAQTSKSMEPDLIAYQKNPAHFESVGNSGCQAGFSPQTHKTVKIEPAALPSVGETLTTESSIDGKSNCLTPHKSVERQYPSGQCRRLYGCIQAAASRLENSSKDRSTQRVTHLTKLIQRSPDYLGIEH